MRQIAVVALEAVELVAYAVMHLARETRDELNR